MQTNLREWVEEQLQRRNWSLRELARQAGTSHSSMARIWDDDRSIGYRTCMDLSRALNVPPQTVLEIAGLLPRVPEDVQDVRLLKSIYYDLPPDKRAQLVEYAEFLRGPGY